MFGQLSIGPLGRRAAGGVAERGEQNLLELAMSHLEVRAQVAFQKGETGQLQLVVVIAAGQYCHHLL